MARRLPRVPVFEAIFYLSKGRYASADSVAAAILAKDRNDPFGLFYAAEALLGRGDFARARDRYERLLRTAPDWGFRAASPDVRSGLALARMKLGGTEGVDRLLAEGIDLIQAALDRGADDPEYLRSLAGLQVAGDRESALVALQAAVNGGTVDYQTISRDPRFRELRADPRFIAVIERMKVRVAEMRANVEASGRAEGSGTEG